MEIGSGLRGTFNRMDIPYHKRDTMLYCVPEELNWDAVVES